ncbi:MAG: matrixin family metalloprotease [Phycisphaerales bacterium]|nr:matrixin family metalloprotease [Phycisphaerales bacterium]
MTINTRSLLIASLAITSGLAVAGEHGDAFSTCGTEANAQPRQLIGAGIMPADALEYRLTDEQIQALSQPQKDLLLKFEQMVYEGDAAPHVCLHPDTNPKVAEAFEQFLSDLWFADTNPNAFILSARWTNTATDGSGISLGDPVTLTYSFIPDGTNIIGEGPSNLRSFMNSQIGAGTWEALFQTALDAWADVSGLTYTHEPNDDGLSIGGFSSAPGLLGTRGDVRIGGNFIDGNSGILAYNFFPNNGDMVLDTGDVGFYGNGSNSYIRLRNVVTHEAGHGIGLSHIESNSDRFLMEPFIDISFTGPQIDDIRGAQRGYGDFDENNDSFGSATDFNAIVAGGGAPFVGGDIKSLTLRSMDDNSDIDYYAIQTGEPVTLTFMLSPTGGSYQNTAQGGGGGGSFINASAVANLNFSIADSTSAILLTVDATGDGQDESGIIDLPVPGQYFIIIDGDNTNATQTYSMLTFFATLDVPTCAADMNGDGVLDFFDISAFLTAFSNQDPAADFSDDGAFDFFDISAFLTAFGAGCP